MRGATPSRLPLQISVRAPLARPGGIAQLAIFSVAGALVQTTVRFPGCTPLTLASLTDSHGRRLLDVTIPRCIALQNGHAVTPVVVHAEAGPWRREGMFVLKVRPHVPVRLTIPRAPARPVRAEVTFPHGAQLTLYGVADDQGRVTLPIAPPHGTSSVARIAVWTVVVRQSAVVTTDMALSDLLVQLGLSRIMHCWQSQEIQALYYPVTPLRLMIVFPHHTPVVVRVRTDRTGAVTIRLKVAYVQARSAVVIVVSASDGRPRVRRTEKTTVRVVIPLACRGR